MDVSKRKRLEAAGWRIGDAREFLGLSSADLLWVELHELFTAAVIDARQAARLTQVELARRLGSSQSRVAKMEAGDPGISVDFLLRSLIALGLGVPAIGRVLQDPARPIRVGQVPPSVTRALRSAPATTSGSSARRTRRR